MQTGVTVSDGAIKGTLKFIEGGVAPGTLEGDGYFLALKFTASDWDAYDTVKVGLVPSATGMPLQDLKSDPDHDGVFKISDKIGQNLVIQASAGSVTSEFQYDLSQLVLQAAE